MKIGCIVHKNRASEGNNPYVQCEYYVRYGKGIDRYINLPLFLAQAGIVRQAGAYWYYEDANGEVQTVEGVECKFKSKAAFLEALENNSKLKDYFIARLNNSHLTSKVSEEEIAEIEDANKKIEVEGQELQKKLAGEEIEELFNQ